MCGGRILNNFDHLIVNYWHSISLIEKGKPNGHNDITSQKSSSDSLETGKSLKVLKNCKNISVSFSPFLKISFIPVRNKNNTQQNSDHTMRKLGRNRVKSI